MSAKEDEETHIDRDARLWLEYLQQQLPLSTNKKLPAKKVCDKLKKIIQQCCVLIEGKGREDQSRLVADTQCLLLDVLEYWLDCPQACAYVVETVSPCLAILLGMKSVHSLVSASHRCKEAIGVERLGVMTTSCEDIAMGHVVINYLKWWRQEIRERNPSQRALCAALIPNEAAWLQAQYVLLTTRYITADKETLTPPIRLWHRSEGIKKDERSHRRQVQHPPMWRTATVLYWEKILKSYEGCFSGDIVKVRRGRIINHNHRATAARTALSGYITIVGLVGLHRMQWGMTRKTQEAVISLMISVTVVSSGELDFEASSGEVELGTTDQMREVHRFCVLAGLLIAAVHKIQLGVSSGSPTIEWTRCTMATHMLALAVLNSHRRCASNRSPQMLRIKEVAESTLEILRWFVCSSVVPGEIDTSHAAACVIECITESEFVRHAVTHGFKVETK